MAVEHTAGATIYTGNDVDRFANKVVASAIKLYVNTGMRVNRAYTPAAMSAYATRLTGKPYTSTKKGLTQAYNDIREQFPDLNLKALDDPKPFPKGK